LHTDEDHAMLNAASGNVIKEKIARKSEWPPVKVEV
jgi:hypothetical protein